MIAFPLNVFLTVVFGYTGLSCVLSLLSSRRREATTGSRTLVDQQFLDVNHVIMSAAMILMTWSVIGGAVLWIQVALFSVLALSLLPSWTRADTVVDRVDVAGHIFMDLATVWMLAAMPLLMAGMRDGSGSAHRDHLSHGVHNLEMPASATTPGWADAVNVGLVAVCVATVAWWAVRATNGPRYRRHSAYHASMAGAMGVMLIAMNA